MKFVKSKSAAGFTKLEKLVNFNFYLKVEKFSKKIFNFKNKNLGVSLTGFTLLEAIIYLAIVGIIISAVVDFAITMGNTTAKMSANIDASRNRRFALTTVNYLIRNADGLLKDVNGDCSNLSVNPPILALYFDNDNYLPGTCVEKGGGVKITVVNNRLKLTCYPNITNNGQYNACAATADATYFLTGPEVLVTNNNLDFTTSTASTTANSYSTVTTHLKATLPSADQISLRASSEATSTAVMRNEQPNGLISWYKFDDLVTTASVDNVNGNTLTCDGSPAIGPVTPGLVTGSTGSFDFEFSNSNSCYTSSDPANLNFNNAFTLAAWIKPESLGDNYRIIDKGDGASNYKGYEMWVNADGTLNCRVYNGTTDQTISSVSGDIVAGNTYHVACVYDRVAGIFQVHVYKKAVGGVSTSTSPTTVNYLVNFSQVFQVSKNAYFDGVIDELRAYNRALSNSEVWALQSQGAN
ncbi:MAG: LamG-like jellyroll fold domain-containing protein [Patescibacteria group bacterium]|jgi:type II secretory pathway pseudopilin PulG